MTNEIDSHANPTRERTPVSGVVDAIRNRAEAQCVPVAVVLAEVARECGVDLDAVVALDVGAVEVGQVVLGRKADWPEWEWIPLRLAHDGTWETWDWASSSWGSWPSAPSVVAPLPAARPAPGAGWRSVEVDGLPEKFTEVEILLDSAILPEGFEAGIVFQAIFDGRHWHRWGRRCGINYRTPCSAPVYWRPVAPPPPSEPQRGEGGTP